MVQIMLIGKEVLSFTTQPPDISALGALPTFTGNWQALSIALAASEEPHHFMCGIEVHVTSFAVGSDEDVQFTSSSLLRLSPDLVTRKRLHKLQ